MASWSAAPYDDVAKSFYGNDNPQGTIGLRTVFASDCRVDAVMTSSDEYRRRSGECLLIAQYVTGETARNLLLRMAFGWNDLAERADQQKADARPGESDQYRP